MINDEPSVKDMAALWELCMKFIKDNKIDCAETVYQNDRVIRNAYEFIEEICEIVGYVESKFEDD